MTWPPVSSYCRTPSPASTPCGGFCFCEKNKNSGRILGGWHSQLQKQNSPRKWGENVRMCENSSRVIGVPAVVEPVVVPLPPAVIEAEITHAQAAIGVAVLYRMPSVPLPSVKAISRQSSGLYRIRGLAYKAIPPAFYTRSFGF